MQTHNLKKLHKNKRRMIVGRGSKRGKPSGRGGKGQTARAGHKVRPEMRDTIKRLPKLRGRGKNSFLSFQQDYIPVNLQLIEKHYGEGETVSPDTLSKKGLAQFLKGKNAKVKILAMGDITKKISFSGCAFSLSARAKIEKAGGTII